MPKKVGRRNRLFWPMVHTIQSLTPLISVLNNNVSPGPFMLYYFAVVILLNRPFIVNGPNEHENEAAKRCTDAAKTIVDVARVVRIDDLMHFGHTAGKYCYSFSRVTIWHTLLKTFLSLYVSSFDCHASGFHPPL